MSWMSHAGYKIVLPDFEKLSVSDDRQYIGKENEYALVVIAAELS